MAKELVKIQRVAPANQGKNNGRFIGKIRIRPKNVAAELVNSGQFIYVKEETKK